MRHGGGGVVLALPLALACLPVHAIGLGNIQVQSVLGERLRASVALIGEGLDKPATCFNARLSTADGAAIARPQISVLNGPSRGILNVSTSVLVSEPAVTLLIEIACGDAIRKEYSLLLDPPLTLATVPSSAAGTTITITTAQPIAIARQSTLQQLGAAPAAAATPATVARPPRQRVPLASALPALTPKMIAAVPLASPVAARRNVLRLGARDGRDADLVNAIGLRLALADRLAEKPAAASSDAQAPDSGAMAAAAAAQAAQARFAALLRDEPALDPGREAAEQKLQQMQKKMQVLDAETTRLRQSERRSAQAATAAQADPLGGNVPAILVLLLLLFSGVIVWLMVRVKHLKQANIVWDWEENVSAADARANASASSGPLAAIRPGTAEADDLFSHTAGPIPVTHPVEEMPALPAVAVAVAAVAPAMPSVEAAPTYLAAPAPMAAPPVPVVMTPMEFNLESRDVAAAVAVPIADTVAVPPAGPINEINALPYPFAPHKGPAPLPAGDLQFADIRMEPPPVEEISDIMQEAEFWISLQDAQRAAEVLEPYATYDQPSSPLPWLYLFDLYRQLGQQDKYDALHERFQRIFNGKVLTWDEQKLALAGDPTRGIADMPHVAQEICALWQSDAILPYLESLLIDDRDGKRIGFDLPIYREIMFLIAIAYERQQQNPVQTTGLGGKPGLTLAA